MANLPEIFVFADDMFDADPIGEAMFEAGFARCDWTPDRLNGALYMTTSWLAQVAACLVLWDGVTDVDTDPNEIITHGTFDTRLRELISAVLIESGGQTIIADDCGDTPPAFDVSLHPIGWLFLDLNGAGDDVDALLISDGTSFVPITPGECTCIKCPSGDEWCYEGGSWSMSDGVVTDPSDDANLYGVAQGFSNNNPEIINIGPLTHDVFVQATAEGDASASIIVTGTHVGQILQVTTTNIIAMFKLVAGSSVEIVGVPSGGGSGSANVSASWWPVT